LDRDKISIYVEELWLNAVQGYQMLQIHRKLIESEPTRQLRNNWGILQSALNHSALISKLLNPISSSSFAQARGGILRRELTATLEAYPTIMGRAARNNVEHLDERLDLWAQTSDGHLVEAVLPNRSAFDLLQSNSRPVICRRIIILDELIFLSQGRSGVEEISLARLCEELWNLGEHAGKWMADNDPWNYLHPATDQMDAPTWIASPESQE
jgi:hypothetical protein